MGWGYGNGKVILFGEHFVVFGEQAMVSPLDQKIRVNVRRSLKEEIRPSSWNEERNRKAVSIAKQYLNIKTPLSVHVYSEFPVASGLGSSAAFCVAFLRAVGSDDIPFLAHEMEKVYHGTPSGIDTWAAYLSYPFLFRKGEKPVPVEKKGIWLLLVYTHPRRKSVKELVDITRAFKERYPERFLKIIKDYRSILQEALNTSDEVKWGELFNRNHELLSTIGLSTPQIEEVRKKLDEHGALGSKITGAGGGGFIVSVFPSKKDAKKVSKVFSPSLLTRV